jgi:uncharacterized membrane protein
MEDLVVYLYVSEILILFFYYMESNNSLPKIKIRLKSFDWAIEIFALIFLILLIALPIIYLKDLPDSIPSHFNAAGQPDDYGSRSTLWLLPLTGSFMYILMTVLSGFPQIYNYPVKITSENAVMQYTIATRLIRILKTVILIIFSYLSFQTINTSIGNATGLGKVFLPVSLLLTFGLIAVFVVMSLNNKHHS